MSRLRGRWGTRGTVLAAAAVMAVTACATNPATGRRMLSLVSESQEVEMGRSYSQQVEATMAMYDDPDLEAYVARIGQELAAVSERPDLPWSFKIVDDPVVNAFALPGGFIYVTRGILTHFNSEAQLASVVGHEIGHVTARHSVEQMSRAQLGGLLLGVGSILSEDVRRFGGFAQAGLSVMFLSYGRGDEHEADMLGVRYALRDRYDPREAIEVHRMLGRQTAAHGGSGVPNWLSTHPSSVDRIDRIQSQVDSIPEATLDAGRVLRDDYLAMVDGTVFGADPRQGFFESGVFKHPNLKFTVRFPGGWQTANLTNAVMAQSPNEDAILELTISTGGHAQAARAFFDQDGIRDRNVRAGSVNGLPSTSGEFEARTDGGTLEGIATFIDLDGRTYRILGYTVEDGLRTYRTAFDAATRSFDRLTDAAALGVQPMRIELVIVQRPTTLQAMVSTRSVPITLEELAILNGLLADETIPPGRTIKWVVGDAPPGS